MFESYIVGDIGSDCTARYCIKLDKKYTVNEFVQAVLSITTEWGSIKVVIDEHKRFNNPICRYDRGKLLSTLPDSILNKKVVKVEATGGWSLMDYVIYID